MSRAAKDTQLSVLQDIRALLRVSVLVQLSKGNQPPETYLDRLEQLIAIVE